MRKLSLAQLRQHKGINFVGIITSFFCYDGKGEFFMTKRSHNSRDEQGTWDIGGGGLKFGNSAEENVIREVKEEYNAKPLKIDFLGYRDVFRKLADGTPTHWLALDFVVLVNRNEVKINEPDMFDDSGWFTLDNLPTPLHSQEHVIFKKYNKQFKKILNN